MLPEIPPPNSNRIPDGTLSVICGLKADHIATNWQDTILAKRWATLEGVLGVASTKATGL
jgi:hypothetical protein